MLLTNISEGIKGKLYDTEFGTIGNWELSYIYALATLDALAF
jgi:hypothetical protein